MKNDSRIVSPHFDFPPPPKSDTFPAKEPFFESLLSVEDLADAFGFAPQTIRNWVALRQIPFLRVGGRTRFRKRSIEAWLEQKENKPCP